MLPARAELEGSFASKEKFIKTICREDKQGILLANFTPS
jgi:hypothetical protein